MQARAIFRVSRSVEAVAVEAEEPVEAAEARAERLTRKFAHEAKAAADEHDALIRKYAISVQRLWLEQAYQSQEGETPRENQEYGHAALHSPTFRQCCQRGSRGSCWGSSWSQPQ